MAMAVCVRPMWYRQHAFYVANMRLTYKSFIGRHMVCTRPEAPPSRQ